MGSLNWRPPRNPAQQLGSVARRYRLEWPALPNLPASGHLAAIHPGPLADAEAVDPEDEQAALQRMEAVLLLSRESLNSRKLAQYAQLADGTQARTLVRTLNQIYDREGRAFRVEEIAGGFQLMTRAKFAPWLRRLGHLPEELRLSTPALETLAAVAYRQPVLRADIEAIRGVNCGEILRQLMERDLVKIGGRSNDLGRPYLYTTTRYFLQLFGLRSLQELPRRDWVQGTPPESSLESLDEPDPSGAELDEQPDSSLEASD